MAQPAATTVRANQQSLTAIRMGSNLFAVNRLYCVMIRVRQSSCVHTWAVVPARHIPAARGIIKAIERRRCKTLHSLSIKDLDMAITTETTQQSDATTEIVATLIKRARAAQKIYARYTQQQLDEVVTAAGWAIMNPEHNQDAGRTRGERHRARQRRRQDREEPSQDAGAAARSQGRDLDRRHRRISRNGHHRNRAAGRCGGGRGALDQSRRDPRQQHHQRAQMRQRDHPVAFAQGILDLAPGCSNTSTPNCSASAPRSISCRCCRIRQPRGCPPNS